MVSVDLPSILGLIPARGGSKGVPRKNARLLGGRPLVEWSVTSGLASTRLADVVVSTDDEEIASIVAWLAGDESGFTTGADFSCNGGLHMG